LSPDVVRVSVSAFVALREIITNVVTAVVNEATVPSGSAAVTVKQKNISTDINPWDTESMNLSSNKGK
jgi:hypothetical protein